MFFFIWFSGFEGVTLEIPNVKGGPFYIEPAPPSIHPHTNRKRRVFVILLYLSLSLSPPPLPHTAAHTKIDMFVIDSLVIMQQT